MIQQSADLSVRDADGDAADVRAVSVVELQRKDVLEADQLNKKDPSLSDYKDLITPIKFFKRTKGLMIIGAT